MQSRSVEEFQHRAEAEMKKAQKLIRPGSGGVTNGDSYVDLAIRGVIALRDGLDKARSYGEVDVDVVNPGKPQKSCERNYWRKQTVLRCTWF